MIRINKNSVSRGLRRAMAHPSCGAEETARKGFCNCTRAPLKVKVMTNDAGMPSLAFWLLDWGASLRGFLESQSSHSDYFDGIVVQFWILFFLSPVSRWTWEETLLLLTVVGSHLPLSETCHAGREADEMQKSCKPQKPRKLLKQDWPGLLEGCISTNMVEKRGLLKPDNCGSYREL